MHSIKVMSERRFLEDALGIRLRVRDQKNYLSDHKKLFLVYDQKTRKKDNRTATPSKIQKGGRNDTKNDTSQERKKKRHKEINKERTTNRTTERRTAIQTKKDRKN